MEKTSITKIEQKTNEPPVDIALSTIKINKQAIVFVNTKRGAESLAEKISLKIKKENPEPSKECSELSLQIQNVLSKPTKQCIRLSEVIKYGIAFHHAGLVSEQRELIELNFKSGVVKIIVATPTLCLAPDTKIWHDMSETDVSQFNCSKPIFVLSKNRLQGMKAQKIEKKSNINKLVEITSVSGYRIKLTPNHKILIKRDNKKILILASACTIKDKIATIGKINLEKTYLCKFSDFVRIYDLPKDKILNKLEFYFLGAMLGDGYSGAEHINNRLILKGSPCIVGKDKEVFDIVKGFCDLNNINYRYRVMPSKCDGLVLSKTNWFREFICNCGVEKGENKYINNKLMLASDENVAALLRGLFDTDGYVEKNKDIGISSISKNLIHNIQKMLLRLGIVTRLRKRKGKIIFIEKKYNTKECYELTISNNESIHKFYSKIGFSISRKSNALKDLINKIGSNIKFVHCAKCDYKIYYDLFSGRNQEHKKWGKQKLEIISLLGRCSSLTSNQITNALGYFPIKKERRLNHHYELVYRKRMKVQNTKYMWSLNTIGKWIYSELLEKNKNFRDFFQLEKCPVCKSNLEKKTKSNWRSNDFDGDIYWEIIREIKIVNAEENVYDVILPKQPSNDHLFVADGFIVHNSMGIDLPAFRVIIRDLKRFGLWGMDYIPVLEYEQQSGRAGRPSYDKFGEAIAIANSEKEKTEIRDKYVFGDPEEILSKLAAEPILRTCILSLVASEFVSDTNELEEFFSRTFYAQQFGDMKKLNQIIHKMLDYLEEWGFIEYKDKSDIKDDFVSALKMAFSDNTKIKATLLGKRVSELYLDPYTANFLITHLKPIHEKTTKKTFNTISLMHLVCSCLEIRPLLNVKVKEIDDTVEFLTQNEESFITEIPEMFDEDYDEFLKTLKTTKFFSEWLDEKDEEYLLEKYDVRPGEINTKKDVADWLLYSVGELCTLMKMHSLIKDASKLRFRLKYGAKEELIPLLQLKNIGRVRARIMFNNRIKDISDVKKIDLSQLAQLLGQNIALDVKKQVGQDLSSEKVETKKGKRKGQISMKDYDE